MKIYRPTTLTDGKNDIFCCLTFANDTDRRRFSMGDNFRGAPLQSELLTPYAVVRSTEFPGGATALLGDRQGIGFSTDPMALSRKALDVLLPRIGSAVQLVPLTFDEGDYALVNVVNVIDALDAERSDIERFPTSGRISRILRHVFDAEAVRDQWIFKIPQTPRRAFVTQRFVDIVQQSGLTGFDFEEIWSDETTSEATAEDAAR